MKKADPAARAGLAFITGLREVADHAHGLVVDVASPRLPGELIRKVRRELRMPTLTALDRAVLVELAEGATWEQVADALALTVEETRARYEKTARMWSEGQPVDRMNVALFGDHAVGLLHDQDPRGTAESLDAWWRRHAEPWDDVDDRPVTRLLDDTGS
ncbi:hypothetical protein ABN028_19945 [Actinopolymorpha sp. B17G11]|uniref:hypothetical protein n=1 Tax=Actinopolymorpha sp. B17G11 TaxID=3160861 RepID=UPI0032E4D1E6